MKKMILAGVMGSMVWSGLAQGAVIGHQQAMAVATLPLATMDAIGQQTWFFTHASVGGNMISGMQGLSASNPTRYQLAVQTYGDWDSISAAPAALTPGTIYDAPRGNPGWSAKFTMFNDALRNKGWGAVGLTGAMDKLCYIDEQASAANYINMMTALEAQYPGTKLVYATMPIMSDEDSNNILRNDYNAAVRAHCIALGKLLYDIADIEAHDPNGNAVTFTHDGHTYQRLYDGYTSDGGHLNDLGAAHVAMGWYATAATLVPEPASVMLLGLGAGVVMLRRQKR